MVRPCGKKAAIRRRSRTSGGRFVANGEISALELLIDQTVVETIRSVVNEEHLRREVWFSLEDNQTREKRRWLLEKLGLGPAAHRHHANF